MYEFPSLTHSPSPYLILPFVIFPTKRKRIKKRKKKKNLLFLIIKGMTVGKGSSFVLWFMLNLQAPGRCGGLISFLFFSPLLFLYKMGSVLAVFFHYLSSPMMYTLLLVCAHDLMLSLLIRFCFTLFFSLFGSIYVIVDTLIFLLSFTLCALLPFFSGRLQEAEDRGGGIYAHLSLYYAFVHKFIASYKVLIIESDILY